MSYGHVVLANSKKEFFASIIKWVTRSNWSHSLFTIPPCCGREMGLEAAGNGVSCLPFDTNYRQDPNQGYRMYRLNLSAEVIDAAIATQLDELEVFYGYLDLPWFMWRALNRVLGRDIRNQDNWAWRFKWKICSESVVDYLTACGLGQLFEGFGKNAVCPQDLQEIMDAHPEYFELIETKE